jgi:pimeloyl-ACP methyl ester carboxylesterase
MIKKRKAVAGKSSWQFSKPAHEQAKEQLTTLAERAFANSHTIEDRVGLSRAYEAPDSIYVRGDTAYTAGTQISRWGENFRDVVDDIKLPFGGTKTTYRYEQLQKALAAHPEVKHLVGHSLGGAVILEVAKSRPDLKTTTYGAPVFDIVPKTLLEKAPNRFANRGDPVASLDSNAQSSVNGLGNPHSFNNFHNTSAESGKKGFENADGSVTLFE